MTASFGAEGWAVIIGAASIAATTLVAQIQNGRKVEKVHKEIQPPSDNVSLGALVEGQAQVIHALTQLLQAHDDPELPSPMQIGRRLQDAAEKGEDVNAVKLMRPGEAMPNDKKKRRK